MTGAGFCCRSLVYSLCDLSVSQLARDANSIKPGRKVGQLSQRMTQLLAGGLPAGPGNSVQRLPKC